MNTVQRLPRSTGDLPKRPRDANSSTVYPMERANVSRNDPQPEEHASFSIMESMERFLTLKHFISCPPMSSMKSTSGSKWRAAV